jgi:4-aminobutyrate aminotransferase-like enzyme
MGAVVTRREFAEKFQSLSDFFSTTGGNPVSCQAAIAVLDVIEGEDLQHNALRVGNELRGAIEQLANRHSLIGDIRGPGLFIGVELVRDRTTLQPAPEETKAVVNGMRNRGVLVGREGPFGNCLKIRPPIVFQSSHVEKLVDTLDDVLSGLSR